MCSYTGGGGSKQQTSADPIPAYNKTGTEKLIDIGRMHYVKRPNEDFTANRSSLSTNDSRRG